MKFLNIKLFESSLRPKQGLTNLSMQFNRFLFSQKKKIPTLNEEDPFYAYESNINDGSLVKVQTKNKNKNEKINIKANSQPFVEKEEYRELYKNFSLIMTKEHMKEFDDIKHNENYKEKEYKYGLPSKNELQFTELISLDKEQVKSSVPKTDTETLYDILDMDKDSAFESLILKHQEEFNHELDMYGNVQKAGETQHSIFQFGNPIPLSVINNDKIMIRIRKACLYNRDLPGNIEDVHPNKFIADLRPIEEFRHTPVVPISETDLKSYKNKIEEKNRIGVYFEIKKQTLYYYAFAIFFGIILYQSFKYFYSESEKMATEIEKIRLRRYRYREEEDIN
jgi:hypothetical protein